MVIALAVPDKKEDFMVGKLNLPPDAEKRKGVKGAAVDEPGLTAVDEERAASMADEGGASGSTVESQDEDPEKTRERDGQTRPVLRRGRG
jgi:hypothetical protein